MSDRQYGITKQDNVFSGNSACSSEMTKQQRTQNKFKLVFEVYMEWKCCVDKRWESERKQNIQQTASVERR